MVRSCSAFGCKNECKKDSGIKFYSLPTKEKNNDLRQKWLANIKREGDLPKDENFLICSDHFEEHCFQRDLKVKLPCLFRKS